MKQTQFKNLLFTADDWGISPKVNAGILELAQLGIVKRVSVLANAKYIDCELEALKRIPQVEFGLHFNCTYGEAHPAFRVIAKKGSFLSASEFLRCLLYNRKRAQGEVVQNLSLQLQKLRDYGIEPIYLDGHHHVHLFPGVWSVICPVLKETKIKTIRLVLDVRKPSLKKAVLFMLSVLTRRRLLEAGFQTLPCYYPTLREMKLESFIKITKPTEVITHPASGLDFNELGILDSYQTGRVLEFTLLKEMLS